ncbi:MAG: anti-sigma factor family protein [Acidobacteriota bacterium]
MSEKLSLYVDGMLDDAEARQLEGYIATHPEAARELSMLRTIQKGLKASPSVPENAWFWLQLSGALEERRAEKAGALKRWTRRYWSAGLVTAGAAALAVVLVIREGDTFRSYYQEKKSQVAQVYESGLMKGAIMPLFASVDKEKVLQFALNGNLPLDSANTLQVAKGEGGSYKVEIGRKAPKPTMTLPEFYAAIDATPAQHQIVDSILNYGKAKIQNAVLVGEKDEIAIHADIARLNRMMVSTIAECLEPAQRVHFRQMLADHDAPYTVVKNDLPPAPPEKIFRRMAAIPHTNRYVVIAGDSVSFADMPGDVERLMEHAELVRREMPKLKAVQEMVQQFAERRLRFEQKMLQERTPLRVFGGEDVLTIQFEENGGFMPGQRMDEELVQPRPRTSTKAQRTQKLMPGDWRMMNREKRIDLDAVIGAQQERQQQLEEQRLRQQQRQEKRKPGLEL